MRLLVIISSEKELFSHCPDSGLPGSLLLAFFLTGLTLLVLIFLPWFIQFCSLSLFKDLFCNCLYVDCHDVSEDPVSILSSFVSFVSWITMMSWCPCFPGFLYSSHDSSDKTSLYIILLFLSLSRFCTPLFSHSVSVRKKGKVTVSRKEEQKEHASLSFSLSLFSLSRPLPLLLISYFMSSSYMFKLLYSILFILFFSNTSFLESCHFRCQIPVSSLCRHLYWVKQ